MTQAGHYTPRDTIVLHPYGRYSNAFKFAGEIDVLEALEHVQANYQIDDERISVRGFSMGGLIMLWKVQLKNMDPQNTLFQIKARFLLETSWQNCSTPTTSNNVWAP